MEHMDYEQRYQLGDIPWHHGDFDANLAAVVERYSIRPCKVLDLGCGLGSNAIWLAEHGFSVTGFDLSPTAIAQANERIAAANVSCTFQVGDFLQDPVDGVPFGFVFDRGCLHCMREPSDRLRFADRVSVLLEDRGLWLSLIGNADAPERDVGPPRLTAREIIEAVEPHFEIVSLASGFFGDRQEDPPRAWICLMRKRSTKPHG